MPARHQTTDRAATGSTERTPSQPFTDPHAAERAELARQYDDVIQALLVQTGVDNIDHLLQLMRQQAIDEKESRAIQKEAIQLAGSKLEERLANFSISGIIQPEMQEIEPNTAVNTATIYEADPKDIPRNPNVVCLPWTPNDTPDEIGRLAVRSVQAIEHERLQLQQRINILQEQKYAVVAAAKDAGHFSWSSLAKVFDLTKSRMTQLYDPNTIRAQRLGGKRHYERLREDAAKARQAS